MGPNPNGPRSVIAIELLDTGFFGVRSVGPVEDFLDIGDEIPTQSYGSRFHSPSQKGHFQKVPKIKTLVV